MNENSDVIENAGLGKLRPSAFMAFLPLLAPLVLIALKSGANYPTNPLGMRNLFKTIDFLGSPIVVFILLFS
jgi:GntP family gluconate:H+ symporter